MIHRICVIVAGSILASCATVKQDPYKEYMQLNPGAELPEKIGYGMSADKALATAFGPVSNSVTYSNRILHIYDYKSIDWIERTLPLEDLAGTNDIRLIISKQQCESYDTNVVVKNIAFYLVSQNKMGGFGHTYYERGCRSRQAQQPARVPDFQHLLDLAEEKAIPRW